MVSARQFVQKLEPASAVSTRVVSKHNRTRANGSDRRARLLMRARMFSSKACAILLISCGKWTVQVSARTTNE